MTTDFKCPRCKKMVKVGRLHASYTCPKCRESMLISHEEKMLGNKIYRKNFLYRPKFKSFSNNMKKQSSI